MLTMLKDLELFLTSNMGKQISQLLISDLFQMLSNHTPTARFYVAGNAAAAAQSDDPAEMRASQPEHAHEDLHAPQPHDTAMTGENPQENPQQG